MTDKVENAPEQKEQPSPNENWQDDKRLDESGNPIEGQAPIEKEQPKEEPVKEEPTGEEEAKLDESETPKEEPKEAPKFDAGMASQVQPFLEDAGLVPSEVARAVTDNDGAVTPEIMKALVEKHGEGVASLLKDKLTSLHESNVSASKAADNKVFSQVEKAFEGVTEQSGAETFKELSTWAKENMSSSERADINKLLAQGGKAAELAIGSLVDSFKQSDSFVSQPAALMQADDTSSEYGGKPLDKGAYDHQLRKLLNEGHSYDTSPEIAALNSRRMKSIARGN